MRLAYKDLSVERQKQEDKLKTSDPKKAEQMERLGMGWGGGRYNMAKKEYVFVQVLLVNVM